MIKWYNKEAMNAHVCNQCKEDWKVNMKGPAPEVHFRQGFPVFQSTVFQQLKVPTTRAGEFVVISSVLTVFLL